MLRLILLPLLLLVSFPLFAQSITELQRCATTEALETYLSGNPAARAQYQRNMAWTPEVRMGTARATEARITAEVTIPVVVHLVLAPADLEKVTEADVLGQIEQLNRDFSGLNADSANGSPFFRSRGHTRIRFALARRTPEGRPTNGIVRVPSSLTGFSPATINRIKYSSVCGSDAWDTRSYLNIWVARSGSILGVATFPGTGPEAEQGIIIGLQAFGRNPAYARAPYNGGRTLVHETGHYLGLYHTWGDENGCNNSDFRQLPGACLISNPDLAGTIGDGSVGDTPNQAGPTRGCPSGSLTDNCSGSEPGLQYQNYMDYTDDGCYSMFSQRQAERMEYVLANCRPSLLQSVALQAPPPAALDASLSAVFNPGNGTCGITGRTAFCGSASILPSIEIYNSGTDTLRSLVILTEVDGTPAAAQTWTGALPPYGRLRLTLNAVPTPASAGNHSLRILLSNPNSGTDAKPEDNERTVAFTASPARTLPLTEGFEGTVFPPDGWSLRNPDGATTWNRTTAAGHNSTASAWMDLFDYEAEGQRDELLLPHLTTAGLDSLWLHFSVAYTPAGPYTDSLQVRLSTNCGQTFTTVYYKGGQNLQTAPSSNLAFTPGGQQWRREKIDLTRYSGQTVTLEFSAINGWGNNLYVDEVEVNGLAIPPVNPAIEAVLSPLPRICLPTDRPRIALKNRGADTLRSAAIIFRLDGGAETVVPWTGALPRNGVEEVVLPQLAGLAAGPHRLQFYLSGFAGPGNSDDTTTHYFTVREIQPLSNGLSESFTSALFPPRHWDTVGTDPAYNWTREATTGSPLPGSALLQGNAAAGGHGSWLLMLPTYRFSGIDSLFLHYRTAAPLGMDTLSILLSKDCGNTFTALSRAWGATLSTAPATPAFTPSGTQWRRDSLNLTPHVTATEQNMTVAFRYGGLPSNRLYLDDVRLYSQTLPPVLKETGFLILPTVTRSAFGVWHYEVPHNLAAISVYAASGQLIWQRTYAGGGEKFTEVDISTAPAGLYFVECRYRNGGQRRVQKVLKQ